MDVYRISLKNTVKPGQFCTYHRHRSVEGVSYSVHDHDYYELFWVEEGPGIHDINGEARTVEMGTLQLIRPEDQHTFRAISGHVFELTNVTLFPETWHALRDRYFPDGVSYFDLLPHAEREFPGMAGLIGDFRAAAADLHAGRRDKLSLERFLLDILSILRNFRSSQSHIPAWMQTLAADLQNQANFVHGIARVVAEAHRSPEHVCREFRKYYGCTPTEAMNEARLTHAALLLRNTDLKIVDLCLELGLENLGYFYRIFGRKFGCTPSEFRRAHAKNAGA